MQVFISSLIRDWQDVRDAAASAVTALGHRAVRAEDFQASPDSPQAACLAGVRQCDVMILLLGAEYGPTQASGLSATHEEYREGRDVRPVIVFIAEGMSPEPPQAADGFRNLRNYRLRLLLHCGGVQDQPAAKLRKRTPRNVRVEPRNHPDAQAFIPGPQDCRGQDPTRSPPRAQTSPRQPRHPPHVAR